MPFFRRAARAPETPADPIAIVHGYHQRTKHHLQRYAAALGYLDWDNQPDPFKRYEGAPLVPLLHPTEDRTPPFEELDRAPARPYESASLAEFLFLSLSLSAWKSVESARWSLRVNPSSGNLHPTEAWLVLPGEPGAWLAHYAVKEHALERRALFPSFSVEPGTFLVALTSIPWRESWKYGERAFRYCQHDVGHALGALAYAAGALGWRLTLAQGVDDDALTALLGLDREDAAGPGEPEHPDLVVAVSTGPQAPRVPKADEARHIAEGATWFGRARALSSEHQDWPVIDVVAAASRSRGAWSSTDPRPPARSRRSAPCGRSAGRILRQRRSAVAMDGTSRLSLERFGDLLARTLPASGAVPWDAWPWPAAVHLGLFVHRVDDLAPGLYLLVRHEGQLEELRAAMRPSFTWERERASDLPLFTLATGDVRRAATLVSCQQEIAAEGAFAVALLARFLPTLQERGADAYRHLHAEAGLVGQVLYLEAEAAGLSATGIGCFFDDETHQVFGLTSASFQSLYHFTVGGAVEDVRLASEPAYARPDPFLAP